MKPPIIFYTIPLQLIYEDISIKKAIIVVSPRLYKRIIKELDEYDHSVTTHKRGNYLNTKLLVLKYHEFNKYLDILAQDDNIDTLFFIEPLLNLKQEVKKKLPNINIFVL